MSQNDSITRCFSVVDQTLRQSFPRSYWKRCMYAAIGMREMLCADGVLAEVVYGDVACFTISPDAQRAGWQGFANDGKGPAAHFWVETADVLLDVGTHYLPAESSWSIARMPLVRWPLNEAQPSYLRYHERGRRDIDMRADLSMEQRVADFVGQCMTLRQSDEPLKMSSPTWQLACTPSLREAAQRPGDIWARAALQIAMGRPLPPAPF